ncbi:MAG TPA: dipeptidase [Candidatus Binatia bacterium]|nr:dipeptidase [Candidatus Binatia bacterium]
MPERAAADLVAEARALLADAPVFDGHNDLAWEIRRLSGGDLAAVDPGASLAGRTHTDLERLVRGGVGAQFWSVYAPSNVPEVEALAITLEQVDLVRRMVDAHPGRLALAVSAGDCLRARASGRIASLLGAEGGHCIAGSLGILRDLHRLGVRYLTLTHNDSTAWADSATDQPRAGGLSDLGRQVVGEMNRVGMLVDISHVAVSTMHAALDATTRPVIFSHSSARALVDHPRNVPDDVLQRLSGNGGVCQVAFVPSFVSTPCWEWTELARRTMAERGLDASDLEARMRFEATFAAESPPPRASVADVADHVDHVREAAGVDHVGLGGDFDGTDRLPEGLEDVSCYPHLIAELLARGWSRDELARLTWANALRVVGDACA